MREYILALLFFVLVSFVSFQLSVTDSHIESEFVGMINEERIDNGIHELIIDDELVAVARQHSEDMYIEDDLFHSDNLGGNLDGWDSLGENVGTGGSVDSLHAAFMDSDDHKENILRERWRYIGVGVFVDSGTLWVTQIFMEPKQSEVQAGSNQVFVDDADISDIHRGEVHELYDRGILDGYEDGTFRPHEKVTREQLASILCDIIDCTG